MRNEIKKGALRAVFAVLTDAAACYWRSEACGGAVLPHLKEGELDKQTANYEKSVADHLEAGRLDPHDAEYRQSLCKARSSQGVREWKYDSDTALACYTTAIETGPANNAAAAAAYSGRASVYSERGEYDKAIADLTESIRIQGMNGENPAGTYLVRGHAHDDAKDYARARVDYEKAAELEPDGCWGSKARENLERLRKAGR